MPEGVSTPVCARCGCDRITYKEGDQMHIVLPFSVPADAPLSDRDIERYVGVFAGIITDALVRHRKERGDQESRIIRVV